MPAAPADSLYDHLTAAQKSSLDAIKKKLPSLSNRPDLLPGTGAAEAPPGEPLIDILENWLLDEEQKQELAANREDIYFLYAAAWLLELDAGPLSHPTGSESNDPGSAAALPDLIRSRWQLLGISDRRQADILGQIFTGYLAAEALDTVIAPVADDGGGRIHVQFLAACLRLAAAFNITAPTATANLRAFLPDGFSKKIADWPRHFTVISTGPHAHVPATVAVRLRCRHAEVHRALKHYESSLQRLLSAFNRLIRPRFLYTAVVFEIEPIGYSPIDFRFSVDTSSALQLFMGNTLYKDRRVFLRELVQNAVDACNLRKLNEPDLTPSIQVTFNADISRITVRDNGIGMSRQWIEKYFLNIGMSFYQSAEIARINRNRDQRLQFSFISRFGIGFLSSFLVADRVIVKTRKNGSEGLQITISRIDDYFDVRVVENAIPVGTEVTVCLKKSQIAYCRSVEYLGYLKTNVRFLPMAVTFVDENGNTSILGREPMDYSQETLWGKKFVAKLDYERSQGYLLLRVRENNQYIYDLEPAQGGISVFQDGIFIDQVEHLLPDSATGYVTGRINLVGDEKCELSMDRNHLYWSKEQLAQTRHTVLMGLVAIANQLLATTAQQGLPENVRRNLTRKLGSFFDFNQVDDTIDDRLHPELRSLVQDKFRTFIRANRFQFDLARHRKNVPDISHGYSHAWQQRMIDRFAHTSAAGSRNRQASEERPG